jgi:hypothetical protein
MAMAQDPSNTKKQACLHQRALPDNPHPYYQSNQTQTIPQENPI